MQLVSLSEMPSEPVPISVQQRQRHSSRDHILSQNSISSCEPTPEFDKKVSAPKGLGMRMPPVIPGLSLENIKKPPNVLKIQKSNIINKGDVSVLSAKSGGANKQIRVAKRNI